VKLDIAMEEHFAVPIERVWAALTDAALLERWLMRADGFAPRPGTRFVFGSDPESGSECGGLVECEVLELAPPHRMVWSWRGRRDPATTRLVIELAERDGGTRLSLRHTGEADERTATGTNRGWTEKLRALVELLTTEREGPDD
jgi:uncharacterized protein YndB with AHSA1/START domain